MFHFISERQALRNSLLFTDWKSWELPFFQMEFLYVAFRLAILWIFFLTFPSGIQVPILAGSSCWVNQVFCSIFHRHFKFSCLQFQDLVLLFPNSAVREVLLDVSSLHLLTVFQSLFLHNWGNVINGKQFEKRVLNAYKCWLSAK